MMYELTRFVDGLKERDYEENKALNSLRDILFLTEAIGSDRLFCDLRGDVDVIEGLSEIFELFDINDIYYPSDQYDSEYDLKEFERYGWTNKGSTLENGYEAYLLER